MSRMEPTTHEVGLAVAWIEAANKKNVNSFTDVRRDLNGHWNASGIFAQRGGITLTGAIIEAAIALGWEAPGWEAARRLTETDH